jgi:hypothetical protein
MEAHDVTPVWDAGVHRNRHWGEKGGVAIWESGYDDGETSWHVGCG